MKEADFVNDGFSAEELQSIEEYKAAPAPEPAPEEDQPPAPQTAFRG